MTSFTRIGNALEIRHEHEIVRIDPWGPDSVRVRSAQYDIPSTWCCALTDPPPAAGAVGITITGDRATLTNGDLIVDVHDRNLMGTPLQPLLRFTRKSTGTELLAEDPEHFAQPGARVYYGNRARAAETHQQFRAYDGERLYGMGQRTHGFLDQKGLTLDLMQRNAEVSIPFALSTRGYGFLWNNPAIGHVTFARNVTRWVAAQTRAIDYYLTTGTPRQILSNYADATGHAPRLPAWASGFWQSKLRYRSQEELLDVAREYRRRNLPLSVIVTDYFHWPAMGDWRFDPAEYPDPQALMRELDSLDIRLMVSIWPTVAPDSENYPAMHNDGLLVGSDQGVEFHAVIQDKGMTAPAPVAFYDPTNPRTREFVWETVKKNYHDLGVRVWWLDASEPELNPGQPANMTLHAGPGAEVAGIYPLENARLFTEGMQSASAGKDPSEAETVLLCRSAWAGQQRYPAAVWSGDIPATWNSLQRQVRAGLNIAMAGIPWWTTDIGGFHGGDASDPAYQELIVRWFQYGAFCPLFRLHGNREPHTGIGADATGGPNEVWSFGDDAYPMIADVLRMRERLRPYIHQQMDIASEHGIPVMRPLFVDFADDPRAWEIEDQYLFGTDILVAPITEAGARARSVYLPEGARWTHVWSGDVHEGGQSVTVPAPLAEIPLFLRDDAALPIRT